MKTLTLIRQRVRTEYTEDPVETTLLELVEALGDLTDDDREIVAVVLQLLREGRVRLTGSFKDQRLAVA